MESLLEELGDSRAPCARVLSVPGFFALLERFLPGRGFILEGERRPLCAEDPLSHGILIKSVKLGIELVVLHAYIRCTQGGCTQESYLPRSVQEGIYPPWYTRVYIAGVHLPPLSPPVLKVVIPVTLRRRHFEVPF